MDPTSIHEFVRRLKDNQEFIVATRMSKGAWNEEDDQLIRPRKWFCQALGLIANFFWSKNNNRTTDITQGYRAMTRKAFIKMGIPKPNPIAPDYEQVIRALKRGIKINEFPTKEGKRIHGETSMKSIRTAWENIKVLMKEI